MVENDQLFPTLLKALFSRLPPLLFWGRWCHRGIEFSLLLDPLPRTIAIVLTSLSEKNAGYAPKTIPTQIFQVGELLMLNINCTLASAILEKRPTVYFVLL